MTRKKFLSKEIQQIIKAKDCPKINSRFPLIPISSIRAWRKVQIRKRAIPNRRADESLSDLDQSQEKTNNS